MTVLPSAHTALHTLARLNQVVSSSLDMDKVLHDIGLVDFVDPFAAQMNQ